jgi:signal transduction histidine kinase
MLYWGMKQEEQIQYQPEMVSIAKVVGELVKLNSYSLEKKEINLEAHLNEDIEAYCDISLFKISLRNILTNAVKYTPMKGTIRISSSRESDQVKIIVSDTGIGMEKEIIDRLSENKIEKTAGTSGERGTGIGLIVVKDLMKINKGVLDIESKPGRGTSVTFTLPGKP